MGRLVTLAIGGACLFLAGCSHVPRRTVAPPVPPPQAETPPVAAPVERPAPAEIAWPVKRLRNADFVNLRDVVSILGLEGGWTEPAKTYELRDGTGRRFAFESGQDEFRFDGLRVFLGERIIASGGALWVSKLDVIKSVLPLLKPHPRALGTRPAKPRTIVLDAGHGGVDPGTENKRFNLKEKTVTLDVALRTKQLLERRGWLVVLTRTEDRELSPDKRTDLRMRDDWATQHRADLFLSIHFNHAEPHVAGVETYTMAPQFMRSSGEGKADDMTGIAYPGNRSDPGNLLLGERLHRSMLRTLKAPDRGLKRGRQAVLRMLECPGVLVECAYLSNDDSARRLAGLEYREQIAQAIAAGVESFAAAGGTD